MAASKEYKITELTTADFDEWSTLFNRYLDFYKTSLDQEQYRKTFERLTRKRNELQGLVVREEGNESTIVGFAHFFPMQTTWSEKKIMFLDDIFVDSSVRNKGLGRMLIQSVAEIARSSYCLRVQWVTQHDNVSAQALYNKLAASLFKEYRLGLN
ncbi:GNAT family N-acetyltransferase [Aspergillus affinis]|uniref:GNAT family N-acetyltransferase n=1 Tax=Aspergillus affinis TaxID=1070780 RepID=UPI0022FE7199|nr:acyl-CoA N-acyltransferase [Aspergillus affinis]KAI9042466.1 acyl-CoA N-acyltransferase [Aspergillus affinis]